MGLRSLDCIFPVLRLSDRPGERYSVLGTGFFIREDGTFLTARHVIEGAAIEENDRYGIALIHEDDSITTHEARIIAKSKRFDIAMGRVDGVNAPATLRLASGNPAPNHNLVTAEFSGVSTKWTPEGIAIDIAPDYQVGHVVRARTGHFEGSEGALVLEVSFPALRGASGAPLIFDQDFSVVGMILGNVERHLLPAQIEKIEGGPEGPVETRYYFLPRAYAISWVELKEFVDESIRAD